MMRAVYTILLLSLAGGAGSSQWPQWRGNDSQGVSQDKDLPAEWSDTKNVLWKTAIPGQGFSQPIIWDKNVFLTTDEETGAAPPDHKAVIHMDGGKVFTHPDWVGVDKLHNFRLLCLDRDSGKIVWDRSVYSGTTYDYRSRRGSYAAPTPVADGRRIYAYFGSEGVYCYDFSGAPVWKKSLGGIGTLGMGVGTSPVLFDNLLIVLCDQESDGKDSFLVALDKNSGTEVWRVQRPVSVSWATPVIARAGERAELVAAGNEFIISYDPKTGRELWRAAGLKSHAIATPAVKGDLVILSSGFPSKVVKAIRLGGSGVVDGTDRIVWTYNKGTAYVPSPILYGDSIYLLNDGGVMTCLNADTGAVIYEGGRIPVPATFYGASPVAFDGKILITCDEGDTFVIRAGPKHEVIATNSIGEPVRSSIAIAGGRLFLRGGKHLFCIGLQ